MAQAHGTGVTTLAVGAPDTGHTLVLVVRAASASVTATSVSGGLVSTWSQATGFTDTLTASRVDIFYGTVTGSGSATATVTFSGSVATTSTEICAQEFASSVPNTAWLIGAAGAKTNGTGTTLTFPTLTAGISGQLYFGYAYVANNAVAGATAGYTYNVTTSNNLVVFNPAANGPTTPSAAQSPSGNWTTVGVVLGEVAPAPAPGLNQNFPQMEYAWGPVWNANGGDVPLDRFVDVTPRSYGSAATTRGRQYELDQVQAGTLQISLSSVDGALDPNNVNGPYAGNIWPYQPFRMRAQWPPTANILDPVIANGGDGMATGNIPGGASGIDVFTQTDPGPGQIVASASAYNGTNVFQFNVPSGYAVGGRIGYTPRSAVVPGQTYTFTMRVRNVTDTTSIDVKPFVGWYGPPPVGFPSSYLYGATATLTGSSTATGWTTVSVTVTAPSNTYGMAVGLAVATSPSATCNVQADGWQLERGAIASAFVSPGTWYPMYSGFVERWPQTWDLDGTYGLVSPTAVDAFALLSQRTLRDALTEEISIRNPNFLYTLGDPQYSTTFSDSMGAHPAAPYAGGKYGAGSIASGVSITAATTAGVYTGSNNTVVTLSNSQPGTNTPSPATYISLTKAGIKGPQTPNTWTRLIAFKYTGPTPTSAAYIWTAFDNKRANGLPAGSRIGFRIDTSGVFNVDLAGQGGTVVTYTPLSGATGVNVVDGNWHIGGISMNATTGDVWATIDGNSTHWTAQGANNPVSMVADSLGGWVDPTVGNGTAWNYKGDISYAMEFPSALTSSDFSAIYGAWRNAFTGDSSDTRYMRILVYAGYTGPRILQAGQTTSMGPMMIDGQDALSALNDVVTTENGEHFVDRAGNITFRSRAARYNSTKPVYTFGERTDLGELPYESIELDYDPTHLGNLVTVTQKSTGQTFTGADTTSQTNYFPRTLTRTVDTTSALEAQDAASYLVQRYKNPLPRVSKLELHPSGNPGLWAACLSLELGTRVRILRRPLGAPAIEIDAFVEHLQWNVSDKGEATLELQCSPIDPQPYAEFAAWRTTLGADTAVGATSVTVNAPAFDSINALAAQITPGQKLVVGQGGAVPETMTIQSVSNTGPNWTTGTITFTAALAHSHTNGFAIGEPLPAGVTDVATYDSSAVFDSAAFSY
jgi:hypothetical protein